MRGIGRVGKAWRRQLEGAVQFDGGGGALVAVRSVLVDHRALLARLAIIVIFFTIIAVMRAKPSFGL